MAGGIRAEQLIGAEVILGIDDDPAIQPRGQRCIGPALGGLVDFDRAGFRRPPPDQVVVVSLGSVGQGLGIKYLFIGVTQRECTPRSVRRPCPAV